MNADGYDAENPLLATGEWLVTHLSDPDIRIVDTRKDDSYVTSHIPGAVALGVAPYLRENGDVLGPDAFGHLMSKLGIDSDTTVIAYDDGNNLFAARLWWVLNYYGHARVKVLDGGWDNWIAQNRPIDSEPVMPAPKQFAANPRPGWIATTDYVQASIHRDDRVIFDVRSDEEWSRVEQTSATLPGHIPGAVHMVWSDVVDRATMRFKPFADLQRMFTDRGVTRDKEIIPYCQGGIRAAHSLFALRVAGFERVRNYEGSWAAWSKSALPVEAASGDLHVDSA